MPQKLPQIYTVIAYICIGKLRDLQYIFAVIYETLCRLGPESNRIVLLPVKQSDRSTNQRPSTKLLSIGWQITGRFYWTYDVVQFSFSKIHSIGNRQLPATHIWLVMLQMNYVITNSVKTVCSNPLCPRPYLTREKLSIAWKVRSD